jgi:comEA protein
MIRAGSARVRAKRAAFASLGLLVCFLLCASAQTKKHLPAKPLDLNAATIEELQQLPGIGPTTAKAIVQFRKKSGRFRRVGDLLAIRGITKRKLEKLRPYVTVGPTTPSKTR